MAKNVWIAGGKKANAAALRDLLAQAFADKLGKLQELRASVLSEQEHSDARSINKETKKRWRLAEQEARRLERELRRVGGLVRKQEREQARSVILYTGSGARRAVPDREIRQMDVMFHPAKFFHTRRDGVCSFHCKFTSRGFGERRKDRSRKYRLGEALKHLRYIVRESAREIEDGGLVSNISQDVDELARFFAAIEELETHDRSNANVYMSLVISLPHELSAVERMAVLRQITDLLAQHDLPYAGVLHAPDPRGDQRNYHAHIMFSLRAFECLGSGRYVFSVDKLSDLNDATFIKPFRQRVSDIFNVAMQRAGYPRRFTPLSNKERGLPEGSGKSTPGLKHRERKEAQLRALQNERALRSARQSVLERLKTTVVEVGKVSRSSGTATVRRLREETSARILAMSQRVRSEASTRREQLAALRLAIENARPAKHLSKGVPFDDLPAKFVPTDTTVARTQPADRGSERRRSIAAAARRLRDTPMVPIVQQPHSFAVSSTARNQFAVIDAFEAETLIQRLHRQNFEKLLRIVRERVRRCDRMPPSLDKEVPSLDPDFLAIEYRSAFLAAAKSDAMRSLLSDLRDEWRLRTEKEKDRLERENRITRTNRERHATALEKKVSDLVADGGWPEAEFQKLRVEFSLVRRELIAGRLIMRGGGNTALIYAADDATRGAIARMLGVRGGEWILRHLGSVTLDHPLPDAMRAQRAISLTSTIAETEQAASTRHVRHKSRDDGFER